MRFYRLGDTITVRVAEDRSMCAQQSQVVQTAWVEIDLCELGCRSPMSSEAVEKKFRRLLNISDCAAWPPIVGHWEGERLSSRTVGLPLCDFALMPMARRVKARNAISTAWCRISIRSLVASKASPAATHSGVLLAS